MKTLSGWGMIRCLKLLRAKISVVTPSIVAGVPSACATSTFHAVVPCVVVELTVFIVIVGFLSNPFWEIMSVMSVLIRAMGRAIWVVAW